MNMQEIDRQKQRLRIARERIEAAEKGIAMVEAALGKETPVSEQVWETRPSPRLGCDIVIEGTDEAIASSYTPEMTKIILGIPALVKAVKHTGWFNSSTGDVAPLSPLDILKQMGVD